MPARTGACGRVGLSGEGTARGRSLDYGGSGHPHTVEGTLFRFAFRRSHAAPATEPTHRLRS